MRSICLLLLLGVTVCATLPGWASPAGVGDWSGFGYQPAVPVSAFARPASWLDPSRLQIATSISVGSGGLGQGMDGLQVTSLSYQFAAPLAMRVSLGNAFGARAAQTGGRMFLEGLDLQYRPYRSFQIQLHYQDFRSPLQLSPYGERSWFLPSHR